MPTPIVYFDLETTGLPHGGHLPDIIQIGAVDSYNQQAKSCSQLCSNYFISNKKLRDSVIAIAYKSENEQPLLLLQ